MRSFVAKLFARRTTVYVIAFDSQVFGIFRSREAAEAGLAQQIADGGPAWSSCSVEERRVA